MYDATTTSTCHVDSRRKLPFQWLNVQRLSKLAPSLPLLLRQQQLLLLLLLLLNLLPAASLNVHLIAHSHCDPGASNNRVCWHDDAWLLRTRDTFAAPLPV